MGPIIVRSASHVAVTVEPTAAAAVMPAIRAQRSTTPIRRAALRIPAAALKRGRHRANSIIRSLSGCQERSAVEHACVGPRSRLTEQKGESHRSTLPPATRQQALSTSRSPRLLQQLHGDISIHVVDLNVGPGITFHFLDNSDLGSLWQFAKYLTAGVWLLTKL